MDCVAVTSTLDDSPFPPHAAALSLPTMHPNGRSHAGQPVPTYSTVSLALWPHVVTVSVPPSGTPAPRSSAYSNREPPKNARKPLAHVPDVYMPGVPAETVDSRGEVPLAPISRRTSGSPRQTGGDGDGVAVRVAVGLRERVRLGVPDGVALLLRDGRLSAADLQGSAMPPDENVAGTSVSPPSPLYPQHATVPTADRAHV